MGRKRIYSGAEKAEALSALKACGGNIHLAAKLSGVPRRTLGTWAEAMRDGKEIKGVSSELIAEKQGVLRKAFDTLAERLTGVLNLKIDQLEQNSEALAKTPLKDIALSSAIATDKSLLLAGSPTKITQSITDKSRYEAAIRQMIDEAKRAGMEVDRDEAIRLLQPHLPEINEYIN